MKLSSGLRQIKSYQNIFKPWPALFLLAVPDDAPNSRP